MTGIRMAAVLLFRLEAIFEAALREHYTIYTVSLTLEFVCTIYRISQYL